MDAGEPPAGGGAPTSPEQPVEPQPAPPRFSLSPAPAAPPPTGTPPAPPGGAGMPPEGAPAPGSPAIPPPPAGPPAPWQTVPPPTGPARAPVPGWAPWPGGAQPSAPPGYPPQPPGYPPPGYPPPPPGYPPPGYPPPPPGYAGWPAVPGYPTQAPPWPPPGAWHAGDRRQPVPGWTAAAPPPVAVGRFRALGIPEIVDAAFTLFRRNFLLIVAIAAVIAVPTALFNYVLSRSLDLGGRYDDYSAIQQRVTARGDLITSSERDSLVSDLSIFLVYLGLVVVVEYLVLQPLGRAATTRAVSDRYLDRPASVGSSFGAALRSLGALVGASLIQVLGVAAIFGAIIGLTFALAPSLGSGAVGIVFLLGVASFLPMIYVYVRWSLAPQAIVIERIGPIRGLARSWRLTQRSFWRTLWLYLLLLLLTGLVSLALSAIAGAPVTTVGSADRQLAVHAAVTAVVGILVSPLTFIASTIYYYDLRIRREAFDLEMLAESL